MQTIHYFAGRRRAEHSHRVHGGEELNTPIACTQAKSWTLPSRARKRRAVHPHDTRMTVNIASCPPPWRSTSRAGWAVHPHGGQHRVLDELFTPMAVNIACWMSCIPLWRSTSRAGWAVHPHGGRRRLPAWLLFKTTHLYWIAAQPMHVVEHLISWWLMFLT